MTRLPIYSKKLDLVDLWELIKIWVQKFLQFFLTRISRFKIREKFTDFLQNAKNRIRIICDYSSNMTYRGLKIWQQLFQIKCFRIVNESLIVFGGRLYMLIRLDPLAKIGKEVRML